MVEFNPDGSIKLPGHMVQHKAQQEQRFLKTACVKVTKDVIIDKKKCELSVELSPRFLDNRFVTFLSKDERGETPIKVEKNNEKNFTITIGSSFRRCSECTNLIRRFRQHTDGNLILKQGNCPYEPRRFSFEDHFE